MFFKPEDADLSLMSTTLCDGHSIADTSSGRKYMLFVCWGWLCVCHLFWIQDVSSWIYVGSMMSDPQILDPVASTDRRLEMHIYIYTCRERNNHSELLFALVLCIQCACLVTSILHRDCLSIPSILRLRFAVTALLWLAYTTWLFLVACTLFLQAWGTCLLHMQHSHHSSLHKS